MELDILANSIRKYLKYWKSLLNQMEEHIQEQVGLMISLIRNTLIIAMIPVMNVFDIIQTRANIR